MARAINKLSARGVATMSNPGRHADGGGLYLNISNEGRRRWVFLYRKDGRRIEMGLGSAGPGGVSLADARAAANDARAVMAAGGDPLASRREAEAASVADAVRVPTFGAFANDYIAAHKSAWRNAKHRAQWGMTLEVYAAPIRDMPVDAVDTAAVLGVLTPLWSAKPETASRLRGRIEAVLDAAKAKGLRTGENPARWRGHLSSLLPKRQKLTRGHHAALPFDQVPDFIQDLRCQSSTAARALEFTILTATRSGEALGARWDELDEARRIWTIPAKRMKSGREHRVPLGDRARAILAEVERVRQDDNPHIFAGQRPGKSLSNMALTMVLRRMARQDITVHGFRSSFRDWAGETTTFPREVAEAALAHVVGDSTERAYRRGDALDKRRALMEAWADFVAPEAGTTNVIPMRGAQAV